MRLAVIAIAPILFSLASCVDESADLGEESSSVIIDNKIAFNRIAFNRIAFNRIAFNRIAFNRIAFNRLEANLDAIGDLLDTPEGQELFAFVISCALPEGVTLVAPDPTNGGAPIEFFGELGLAPRWVDHPMSGRDRRWVSACMLSRVNDNDVTVTISLRGPHRELTSTQAERETWVLEEGAFYGDIFGPVDQPLQAYACRGRDQASGEGGGLADRDCTEPDPANPGKTLCGMTYAGDCADFEPPKNRYACRTMSRKGYYKGCATSPLFFKWHKGGGHHDDDDEDDDDDDHHDHGHGKHGKHGKHGRRIYHEVITTYLAP